MAITLQPLADRVVVKPIEREMTKGESSCPIPRRKADGRRNRSCRPGKMTEDGKRIAMDVKVGDIVVYAKYGGPNSKSTDKST